MSTAQHPYEPSQRLIDDRQRLARLYIEQDLTVREIADNHAEVTKTPVYEALVDFGIIRDDDEEDYENNCNRGFDPPSDTTTPDWNKLQE